MAAHTLAALALLATLVLAIHGAPPTPEAELLPQAPIPAPEQAACQEGAAITATDSNHSCISAASAYLCQAKGSRPHDARCTRRGTLAIGEDCKELKDIGATKVTYLGYELQFECKSHSGRYAAIDGNHIEDKTNLQACVAWVKVSDLEACS